MTKRVPFRVVKKPTATGQIAAHSGNGNAMTSGVYCDLDSRNLDQRSKLAKTLKALKAGLAAGIPGGKPSLPQAILIDRAVYKVARCTFFEAATLAGDPGADEHYLAWSNSLRLDLQALGLDRAPAPIPSLAAYMAARAAERAGGAE